MNESRHFLKGSSKTAFTLIELLTVIAIIGILAAILIPVVGAARDSARASRCVGNLRDLTLALNLSLEENDGRFHVHSASGDGSEQLRHWADKLEYEGILDNRDVTICPSAHPYDWDTMRSTQPGRRNFRVYGMNMITKRSPIVETPDYERAGSVYGGGFLLNSHLVEEHSRYFVFADSVFPGTYDPENSPGMGSQRYQITDWLPTSQNGIQTRHNNRANLAFLDGSVRAMSPQDLRQLGFFGYVDADMNNLLTPN